MLYPRFTLFVLFRLFLVQDADFKFLTFEKQFKGEWPQSNVLYIFPNLLERLNHQYQLFRLKLNLRSQRLAANRGTVP